jgi:eukaryotic-like serine/threonine-protein kinase
MVEAGTMLQNRYRVERKIGQGGMGAVYIATDERFGSKVAIKETFFSDEKFGKAFEREARLLNNLKHPALPHVSDHFADDNGQFLVMEFIDGEDLTEMLEKRGSAFLLTDVMNWADQLIDALDYLHKQGIVHRDIKPQNLKLNARGQIILLDFGLAKGNPTDAHNTTATKSVFGYSRNYASLEQIQGTGTDPRSDLYALAATLYHLLTGVPPEDALTRAMDVVNNKPDPLKPPHNIHAQVSDNLSAGLMRSMDLNASQRPHSANEMREMLKGNSFANDYAQKNVVEQPNITGIHTQNTQIKQDTNVLKVDTENDTLVKTQITDNPQVFANQTKPKRGGIFAGLAVGGLLLVGGAGATAFLVKPELFSLKPAVNTEVSNTTSNVTSSANNEAKATASAVNTADTQSAETNTEVRQSVETTAKVPLKVESKNVETKNNEAPKVEEQKVATVETKKPDSTPTKTKREVAVDTGDTKIYEDGGIETDDVTISPNGKITVRDTPEKPQIKGRPIPTKEEVENMSPQQRRKMKQIFNRLPPEEKEKIKQEIEQRKGQSTNSPPKP